MDLEPKKILLVDDDEDDYILTRQMLSEAKHGVYDLDWARTYDEGWKLLQTELYDAVLVDYDLGPHNGLELTREAVSYGCRSPIILLTGRGSYDIDVEAMQAGASMYLTKGETSALALERGIRYAIERKENEQELSEANAALKAANEALAAANEALEKQKIELDQRLQERSDILESIQDGFFSINHDWVFTYINHRAAKAGGGEPEDLIGRNIWEAYPNILGSILEKNYRRVMDERIPIQFEMQGLSKGVWYNISVYPSAEGISIFWQDISQRKQIEEQLQERNEALHALQQHSKKDAFLQQILDILPVGVWLTDSRGNIVQANLAAQMMWAGTKYVGIDQYGEYIGWWLSNRKPLTAETWPAARAVTQGETTLNEEIEIQSFDGRRKIISCSALPIFTAGQDVAGAIVVFQDIHELKKAEIALHQANLELEQRVSDRTQELQRLLEENQAQRKLLQAIFDHAQVGIAVVQGSDLRFVMANQSYEAIPGKANIPTLGNTVAEVFPDTAASGVLNHIQSVMETGEGISIPEFAVQSSPDAEETWWKVEHIPLYDEQRNVNQVLMITLDITDQVAARKALEAEQSRLVAMINSAPQGIVLTDEQGRILMTNDLAKQLYARPVPLGEDYESHASFEISYPDGTPYNPRDLPLTRSALDGEIFMNVEAQIVWPDGQRRSILVNSAPIRDAQGRVTGAVGTFQDITDIKQVESALAEYAKQLERSNQDLEDFAFVASHDLQEPLRKVVAFGNRLKDTSGEKLDPESLTYLERMSSAAERMSKMLDDLMDYSRVTTKALPHRTVDLAKVAREVLSDLELQIERSQGTVEIGEMPEIEAEPVQMRQLLQNLIGNALKFSKPGVPPRVKVSSLGKYLPRARRPEVVEIRIEDNGIGFDMQSTSRLFQPFHRLVGHSEYEGSGIGLAICRKIVERHGGSITAQSKPDVGTTFIVRLPVRQAEPTKKPKEQQMKILIVDDSALSRSMFMRALGPSYTYFEAGDGIQGVEIYSLEKPDLVVLDLTMPGQGGLEVLQLLKQMDPNAHVIIGSADIQKYTREEALSFGADGYITKPFTPENIQSVVEKVLSEVEGIRE